MEMIGNNFISFYGHYQILKKKVKKKKKRKERKKIVFQKRNTKFIIFSQHFYNKS